MAKCLVIQSVYYFYFFIIIYFFCRCFSGFWNHLKKHFLFLFSLSHHSNICLLFLIKNKWRATHCVCVCVCVCVWIYMHHFSSVPSLSLVWLFAIPWIAACQASLSITITQSSLKLTSIESVLPSSHLVLCRSLFFLPPNPSQHQSLFQWVNSLHEVAKVLKFQL